uniref:Uncharacterized protein n=1 Tax=Ditylenchus dipsaci TaxID=166011 RepID=A0A915EU58_9BILA
MEKCLTPTYRVRNAFVMLVYCITITSFIMTAYLIRKREKRHHSLKSGDFGDQKIKQESSSSFRRQKILKNEITTSAETAQEF